MTTDNTPISRARIKLTSSKIDATQQGNALAAAINRSSKRPVSEDAEPELDDEVFEEADNLSPPEPSTRMTLGDLYEDDDVEEDFNRPVIMHSGMQSTKSKSKPKRKAARPQQPRAIIAESSGGFSSGGAALAAGMLRNMRNKR